MLFLSESIVLPGMVVPIELDDAARAAVDAAQASDSREAADRSAAGGPLPVLRRPRLDRAGRPRRRRRQPPRWCAAKRRAHIGAGTTGPGAALWVEVTECRRARTDRRDPRAGRRVQEAAAGDAAAARGLADRRLRQPADRPVGAGRHGRLCVVPDPGAEAPAAGDARRRRAAARR